jgi:glycosyltransferase involved in cell wall biosynthesis
MRILMLDNEFPPLGGGTGIVNSHLLEGIAEYGNIQVDLVTSSRTKDQYEHEVLYPGIELYKVPVNNKNIHHSSNRELITYAVRGFLKSRELLQDHSYDLCFAFATFPAGVMALGLRYPNGIPYIVSLQGPDVPGFEARYNYIYPILRPIARLVWKRAAAVTAISEQMRQLAMQTCSDVGMDIIYNGVDIHRIQPRNWNSVSFDSEPVTVICVARLIERKGQHHLLESGAILKTWGLDGFRVLFVGTGDAGPSLKQRCLDLGLNHNVEFKGFVTWEDVIDLYQNAHIFVLPSFNEGMSIALLEAMASGLPVIVTDTGGTQELVNEENGLIVPWADPEALADALVYLLESPERMRRMGLNSRRIAMQFDWQNFTRHHIDLLYRVFEDSRGVQV